MSVNPGHDGTPIEDPTTAELDAAKVQLHLLGEGGKSVKISQFSLFYPGVSRRKVLTYLEALTESGYLTRRTELSPNGKGSWHEWTVNE